MNTLKCISVCGVFTGFILGCTKHPQGDWNDVPLEPPTPKTPTYVRQLVADWQKAPNINNLSSSDPGAPLEVASREYLELLLRYLLGNKLEFDSRSPNRDAGIRRAARNVFLAQATSAEPPNHQSLRDWGWARIGSIRGTVEVVGSKAMITRQSGKKAVLLFAPKIVANGPLLNVKLGQKVVIDEGWISPTTTSTSTLRLWANDGDQVIVVLSHRVIPK